MTVTLPKDVQIQTYCPEDFVARGMPIGSRSLAGNPEVTRSLEDGLGWLQVLRQGLQHVPYLLETSSGGKTTGVLPLALVQSAFFGRFLVSLPYVNSAGAIAETSAAACQLLDGAVALADQLNVRYLELRHEQELIHPALTHKNESKVLMRLKLPATVEQLWNCFRSKLRSQIRSGERHDFEIRWGAYECLDEFYHVFSHNMRDLGTPVYSRNFFRAILTHFPDRAELCVLRMKGEPVASALLTHDELLTEVPSASSLKAFNSTNANMFMYWHLLQRAVHRGQQTFDFGRSTIDSSTFRFKRQWGAEPSPSVWQYYLRRGSISDMRPHNAKYGLAIQTWRRLPVWVTRLIGPAIVRGIP